MKYTVKKANYRGEVHIPSSKSDAQRAILLASLSKGTTVLYNCGNSKDELSMLSSCQQMGAIINHEGNGTYKITGPIQSFSTLTVGESGLGLRLLTAIASLQCDWVTITGEGSLLTRSHTFFEQYFPMMGAQVELTEGKLPIRVKGPLKSGSFTVNGSESSQYISGLLIALTQVVGDSVLTVENQTSTPYIAMTLQALQQFGCVISVQNNSYTVQGGQFLKANSYTIESDWSSASYWIVAAALGMPLTIKGLSMQSLQADKKLLNALKQASCRISVTEEGLKIDGTNRMPLHVDCTHSPDLFPALVAYASLTNGRSVLKGVHRLANKESDRGKVLVEEFIKLGVQLHIAGDEMIIKGSNKICFAEVSSHNDHRIAMCLAIVAAITGEPLVIDQAQAVDKSYPHFWQQLEQIAQF